MSDTSVCGTYAGYHRHRASAEPPCGACRAAKADYMRKRRANARAIAREKGTESARSGHGSWASGLMRYVAPGIKHGTRFGYEEAGCRCFDCTEARTVSDRARRNRKAAR